jgi:sulfur carrier protein
MELVINGEKRHVSGVKTVADLLSSFNLQHKILVVELNRIIIERDQYESKMLQDGDTIEIVHFVGGG